MKKRKPKTSGLEWLEHSIANFNGTKYCDRSSGTALLASYCAYKVSKKDDNAVRLAQQYHHAILPLCEEYASREYAKPEKATDKQIKYLWVLENKLNIKHKNYRNKTKKFASKQISRLIEKIK